MSLRTGANWREAEKETFQDLQITGRQMASGSPTVFEFLVISDCLSVLIPRNLPRRAPAGSLTASGGRTFSSCLTHSSYLSHAKDLTCGQAAAGARRVDRKFEPHCPLSLLPRRPPALVYLRGDAGSDRTPTSRRGAGRRAQSSGGT